MRVVGTVAKTRVRNTVNLAAVPRNAPQPASGLDDHLGLRPGMRIVGKGYKRPGRGTVLLVLARRSASDEHQSAVRGYGKSRVAQVKAIKRQRCGGRPGLTVLGS